MHDAGGGAHVLDIPGTNHGSTPHAVLVLEGPIQDVGDDFHVLMTVTWKPLAWTDHILIDHSEATKPHEATIVVFPEREGMKSLQPSVIKVTALGGGSQVFHGQDGTAKNSGLEWKTMDLNEIQCFKHVAEAGSFSRAARQSRIPKSTLSRKVSDLETRLGVTLLPVFLGHEEVQKNQLMMVMKNWGADREPVHAVYPDQPYLPLKIRLFLDFLKKAFK